MIQKPEHYTLSVQLETVVSNFDFSFLFPLNGPGWYLTRLQCASIIDGNAPAEVTIWFERTDARFITQQFDTLAFGTGTLFTPSGNGGLLMASSYQAWEGLIPLVSTQRYNVAGVVNFGVATIQAFVNVMFDVKRFP